MHSAFDLLLEKYPAKHAKAMRQLQTICSMLAHWTNLFGELDYLPLFAFPFVKLFQNHAMEAFEVMATVLCNWCGSWFEFFPNPPINVLCMIENMIAYMDKELYAHFVTIGLTTETYAWTLLQTAMSEVLALDDWLALWDTLICYHPCFLLFAVAAFSLINRGRLLAIEDKEVFENFYCSLSSTNARSIVDRMHELNANIPKKLHPRALLNALNKGIHDSKKIVDENQKKLHFVPLPKGHYPVVGKYPKFIVDFQLKERERIREAEKDYHEQRKFAEELECQTRIKSDELNNWIRQQELIIKAECQRRGLIKQEEEKLNEQRKNLNAIVKGLKIKQLETIESTNFKIKELDLKQRKEELLRMDEYLENLRKTRREELELSQQLADISALARVCENKKKQNSREIDKLPRPLPPKPVPDDEFGYTETTFVKVLTEREETIGEEIVCSQAETPQVEVELENKLGGEDFGSRPDSVATGETESRLGGSTHESLRFSGKPFDESIDLFDTEDIVTPRGMRAGFDAAQESDEKGDEDNNSNLELNSSSERSIHVLGQTKKVSRNGGSDTDEYDSNDNDMVKISRSGLLFDMGRTPDLKNEKLAKSPDYPTEIENLLAYIDRYAPQHIELETVLKPFIPEYIASVGDIDAFIKVPRPDGKPDDLGLKPINVKSVKNADKDVKTIDKWVKSISDLHKSKPAPTEHARCE
ncbi:TBC1 domain member 31 [Cichlidogyrus casuarinus]|uniref:TBC1 domain member 31 n=1 Tax=Cichlidogyrus casuarinus TaxID=1844966 RepID=A0ABD2QIY1_9PLAT